MEDDKPKGIADIVKEQFALLAMLVLFTGSAYADAYYSQFAIKFSQLGFAASYVIYRGLTVPIESPLVALPYFGAVIWLVFDEAALKKSRGAIRTAALYFAVILMLVLSYALAYSAGIAKASKDMRVDTSTLFKIKNSKPSIDGCPPDECRLVLADSEDYYILHPLGPNEAASIPNIIRIPRRSLDEIITGTQ